MWLGVEGLSMRTIIMETNYKTQSKFVDYIELSAWWN